MAVAGEPKVVTSAGFAVCADLISTQEQRLVRFLKLLAFRNNGRERRLRQFIEPRVFQFGVVRIAFSKERRLDIALSKSVETIPPVAV